MVAQFHITFLLSIFLVLLVAVAVSVCACMPTPNLCNISEILSNPLVCSSESLIKPLKGSRVLY